MRMYTHLKSYFGVLLLGLMVLVPTAQCRVYTVELVAGDWTMRGFNTEVKDLSASSSNKKVVEAFILKGKLVIKAKKVGTAFVAVHGKVVSVTEQDRPFSDTVRVTVKTGTPKHTGRPPFPPETFFFSRPYFLTVGETRKFPFKVEVLPRTIRVQSSDPEVAYGYYQDGKVHIEGLSTGKATIVVTGRKLVYCSGIDTSPRCDEEFTQTVSFTVGPEKRELVPSTGEEKDVWVNLRPIKLGASADDGDAEIEDFGEAALVFGQPNDAMIHYKLGLRLIEEAGQWKVRLAAEKSEPSFGEEVTEKMRTKVKDKANVLLGRLERWGKVLRNREKELLKAGDSIRIKVETPFRNILPLKLADDTEEVELEVSLR